jgi:hypothetical protein
MMILPFAAFWVFVLMGLYMQELSLKAAGGFVAVLAISFVALAAFEAPSVLGIVVYVVLDLILILKIFGGDILIR